MSRRSGRGVDGCLNGGYVSKWAGFGCVWGQGEGQAGVGCV